MSLHTSTRTRRRTRRHLSNVASRRTTGRRSRDLVEIAGGYPGGCLQITLPLTFALGVQGNCQGRSLCRPIRGALFSRP